MRRRALRVLPVLLAGGLVLSAAAQVRAADPEIDQLHRARSALVTFVGLRETYKLALSGPNTLAA